jgi:hypothetical protein
MTPIPVVLVFFSLLLLATSSALSAQAFDNDPRNHIRTTDRRLIRLLRDGARGSETFRRLVDRLLQSNVIVYLECGGTRGASGGRLTFVSSVANWRYVHVRVARLASADVQIALIGHELQHAVEIADAPEVVDLPSLAREYQRIGFVSPRPTPGASFDSSAAVDAGYRVLREISGREARQLPAAALRFSTGGY